MEEEEGEEEEEEEEEEEDAQRERITGLRQNEEMTQTNQHSR